MVNKKSKNKATTTWGNCFDGTLVILTDCLVKSMPDRISRNT